MAGRQGRGRDLIFGFALMVFAAAVSGGGAQAERPLRLVVVTPESEPTQAEEEFQDTKAKATARAQRCYTQLGYYKGPIDGKANSATWTAHWYFKNDHGLKKYGDFLAKPVQKKIKELCEEKGIDARVLEKE